MTDPGRLKTRLVIQAPSELDDGQGGVTRTFITVARVWAAVTPVAARATGDAVEGDAAGATGRYRIVLRSNFSLTLEHRLVDGTRTFRIAQVRDLDDRRFIFDETPERGPPICRATPPAPPAAADNTSDRDHASRTRPRAIRSAGRRGQRRAAN
jgi:head-tail adaptor